MKPVWDGDSWKDTVMAYVWAVLSIIVFAAFFWIVSFVLSCIAGNF